MSHPKLVTLNSKLETAAYWIGISLMEKTCARYLIDWTWNYYRKQIDRVVPKVVLPEIRIFNT